MICDKNNSMNERVKMMKKQKKETKISLAFF